MIVGGGKAVAALWQFRVHGDDDVLAADHPTPNTGVDMERRIVECVDRNLRPGEGVVEPDDQRADTVTDVEHNGLPGRRPLDGLQGVRVRTGFPIVRVTVVRVTVVSVNVVSVTVLGVTVMAVALAGARVLRVTVGVLATPTADRCRAHDSGTTS